MIINGTAGPDTLIGTSADDTISGLDGNDSLDGQGGNDQLNGGTGDDTLTGGAGNDSLSGGAGNDTYVFGSGGGADSIQESGTTSSDLADTLQLGAGLTAADITVRGEFRQANSFDSQHYDLIIGIAGTGDSIRLYDQLSDGTPPKVDVLRFADASTIDLTDGLDMHGTGASDFFRGSVLGDTYHLDLGVGADQIAERTSAAGVVDTLQLGAGLTAADITVRGEFRQANSFDSQHYDLIIGIAGTGDSIRLYDQLSDGTPPKVDVLRFADASTIDLTDGLDMHGTGASDFFRGSVLGDTYHLDLGVGADQIAERTSAAGVVDTLQLGAGLTAADITVRGEFRQANSFDSQHYDLIIGIAGTGDSIRLYDQLSDGTPPKVDVLRFADASTIDLTDGLDMHGTGASDFFRGSVLGDTYHLDLGVGADQIAERTSAAGVVDTLQLGAGLTAADITVRGEFRQANSFDSQHYDLIIGIAGTGDSIRLYDQLSDGTPPKVDVLRFADASTIDLTDGLDMHGTGASDFFRGSVLGDTYHLDLGVGADQIAERTSAAGVVDTLQLGAGLTAADITVRGEFRQANSFDSQHYDLIIGIAGTGDSIRLYDQLSDGTPPKVDVLRFADASTIDLTDGLDMHGTGASDFFRGSVLGDTYHLDLGVGADQIAERTSAAGVVDTLQLGAGLTAADITVRGEFRQANSFDSQHYDLIIGIAGTGDSIRLYDQLSDGTPPKVDVLRFADASTIDLTDGLDMHGTGASDFFRGSVLGDTYHLDLGVGADQIAERTSAAGVVDTLQLGAGLTAADITVRGEFRQANSFDSQHYDLIIGIAGTGDSIRLYDQLSDGTPPKVDVLRFADASTIDLTDGLDMHGTGASDFFRGSVLGDTYHLDLGVGADQIAERTSAAGVVDTLQLGAGLTAADITVRGEFRQANSFDSQHYDLIIGIAGTGDSIRLYDQLSDGTPPKVDVLRFADASTIDLTDGLDMHGTGASDFFRGSVLGDTYHLDLGVGADQIAERTSAAGVVDTLQLGAGLTAADITVRGEFRQANSFDSQHYDLIIGIAGTGDSIRLYDQLSAGTPPQVELLRFADGTTVDLTVGLDMTGTPAPETLVGTRFDDFISAQGGNDTLEGREGNDILDGGTGADVMVGGPGADTYYVDDPFDIVDERSGDPSLPETLSVTAVGIGDLADLVNAAVSYSIDYLQAAAVEDLALLPGKQAAADATGNAQSNRITGNEFDNKLTGRGGNDIIDGRAGTDTAIFIGSMALFTVSRVGANVMVSSAAEGNDTLTSIEKLSFADGSGLLGGDGDDTLTGSAGADLIDGGAGADTLQGGAGEDLLEGGLGNDTLDGGEGIDAATYTGATAGVTVSLALTGAQNTGSGGIDSLLNIENLTGGAFNDVLTGNGSDNTLQGRSGNDTLDGGAGIDTASYASAAGGVTVSLAVVGAQSTGSGGIDNLINIENLTGSGFNDVLTGNGSDNTLQGGLGNDTLDGGAGTDTATYTNATAAVTVSLAVAGAQNTGGGAIDNLISIENLTGSAFSDVLTGNASDNTLQGGLGNDTLDGGAGIDTATYTNATAAVTVSLALAGAQNTAGAGNDTLTNIENLTGSAFNDVLTGNGSANTLQGALGDDTLNGGLGNDTLDGGAGSDTATYTNATAAVTVSLALAGAQNTVGAGTDTLIGVENLTGSALNDVLTGDGSDNTLEGGLGNDTLNGGGGIDTASYASATAAVTVSLAVAAAQNTGGAGSDTLASIENLTGSAFNDVLTGDGSANTLQGGLGNDTLDGGGGADTASYAGAAAAVTVNLGLAGSQNTGAAGSDTLANIEHLTGSAFNDALTGNGSDNTLQGGAGDDTLDGGNGNDTASYAGAAGGVVVNLATTDAQDTLSAGADTLVGIENLMGSAFGDVLTGNDLDNVLTGGLDNDILDGAGGTDVAIVSGIASQYSITLDPGTGTYAVSGPDGTDKLLRVEFLRFTGGGADIPLVPAEITVTCNDQVIVDGDDTPRSQDGTDFGSVPLGQVSVPSIFTVKNDGGTTLTLGTPSLPVGFLILASDPLVSSLAPGTSDTFTVQLNTASAGTWGGQISIANNDSDESPFNFSITGTVTVNHVPVATRTAATQGVPMGQSVAALTLFGATDPEGNNTITRYEFLDTAAGGGEFRVNGIAKTARQSFTVNAADLASVTYRGGASRGSEFIGVRASDGLALSEWAGWTMNTLGGSTPPVVNGPASKTFERGQAAPLSSFLSATDADGDSIAYFEVRDTNGAEGSTRIWANGALQAQGFTGMVNTGSLSDIWVLAGSTNGANTIEIRASDGFRFGEWKPIDINRAPVVTPTASTQGVPMGESVPGSTLFAVADPDGNAITQYQFFDTTIGGGEWRVNGIAKTARQPFTVIAADLANVTYQGGASRGAEVIGVRAFDGLAFNEWVTWTMNTLGGSTPPVVNGPASKTFERGQAAPLSSFLSATDADGDSIAYFEVRDNSSAAGSTLVFANGALQAQGFNGMANTGSLSDIWVLAGSTNGANTIDIRASDGFRFGEWKQIDINRAPVVTPTAAVQGVPLGQGVAASTLFAVTDPDGNAITQYQFFDSGAGGGAFRVNGIAKTAQQPLTVTAADLASVTYQGGASRGSEVLGVRANDGTVWSDWASWTMNTLGGSTPPVVNGPASKTFERGQAAPLSSFLSVTDADGDSIAYFEVRDNNNAAGSTQIWANGALQAQGFTGMVNTGSLSDIWVLAGSTNGANSIEIRASDGFGFGNVKSIDIVTQGPNRAPVVTPAAATQSVNANETKAFSLMFNTTEADGDPITQFQLFDSGAGGGHIEVNGVVKEARTVVPVNSLDDVVYKGGTGAGSEILGVRASDGVGFGEWTNWNMNTLAA